MDDDGLCQGENYWSGNLLIRQVKESTFRDV